MKKSLILGSICIGLLLMGARNPFEPLQTPWEKPLDARSLKQYSLSDLSLQGVIWDTEKGLCLFKTIDGKTFIATLGTPIGKNGGKVSQISDNMVIVKGSFGEVPFKLKE